MKRVVLPVALDVVRGGAEKTGTVVKIPETYVALRTEQAAPSVFRMAMIYPER
jgi:hypothetical protein